MPKLLHKPNTKLAKTLLLLIVIFVAVWVFNQDANNCLARDFVEKAPPAVCWRQTNDYESTIAYSWTILQALWAVIIVFSSIIISKRIMKRSTATRRENKRTALFLTSLSVILLLFIFTVIRIWASTTYNNNNHALNNAFNLVSTVGVPAWLALTTSAAVYGISLRRKH